MYLEFGKCKAGSASAAAAPSGPSEPVESKAAATAADASDVAMICPEDEAEATIEEEVDPLQAEASAKAANQMDHVFIYTHERDFEQALAKNVPMLQQSLGVSVSMQFFCVGGCVTIIFRGPGAAQGGLCHRLPDVEDEGKPEVP